MKFSEEYYWAACQKFTETILNSENVLGIVVSGSLVHGTIHPNSDIDVYIVLQENTDFRERGNTWVDGIEIEYFKNSPQQIRSYFITEKHSPHTAHILAHGRVIYHNSNIVQDLISEAKSILNNVPKPMEKVELELSKYELDDLYKDLEDCYCNHDDLGSYLIRSKIIQKGIDIFCRSHRVWRFKDKGLNAQISSIDPGFAKLLHSCLQFNADDDANNWREFRQIIEQFLGGRRAKEWKLSSRTVIV